MGRLAVDQRQHGNGCGEMLLQNAVKRCLSIREEITYYALVVDAKDEGTARCLIWCIFQLVSGKSAFPDLLV